MHVPAFYLSRTLKYALIAAIAVSGLSWPATVPAQAANARANVGVSTSASLLRMSDKALDARLTGIEQMGATWIRVDFSWAAIQADSPNVYHWQMYDRVVRVAGVHNLKVLGVLDYTPKWAQEPRCAKLVITKAAGTKCNPKNNQAFGRFARAAALRYKGKSVRAWEIWNEPNLSSYWKTAQPGSSAVHSDVRAYAALANVAAREIRRNNPNVAIITGGLAPLFTPVYPKGERQSDYLARLLPLLEIHLFDGVGIHPYSWPVLPSKVASYNAFYTVDGGNPQYNLTTIMKNAGWSKKPFWGTEYGATTKGLRSVTNVALNQRLDHVSEATQAQIISLGVSHWYDKANVGPLFVHADSDQWLPNRKNEGGFGLKRSDGSKKPAYDAFVKASKQIDQ